MAEDLPDDWQVYLAEKCENAIETGAKEIISDIKNYIKTQITTQELRRKWFYFNVHECDEDTIEDVVFVLKRHNLRAHYAHYSMRGPSFVVSWQ